jgi:hypothetical protein
MMMGSPLDSLIRSTITELIESAPQPPTLPELEFAAVPNIKHRRWSDRPWSHGALPLLTVGVAIVAAAVLVAVVLVPGSVRHQPIAAAAELHEIADNAAHQSVPQLGKGQYVFTQEQVTFTAAILEIGTTPTPHAQATLKATIKEWANDLGGSCIVATSGPATFASATDQAAWRSAGMLVNPSGPSTSCALTGSGVIDVSSLTNNPTVLAQELNSGSTGIPGLDQQIASPNAGFDRAVILLIGPTVGATPALDSAVFDAMAKMPGVAFLGQLTTHTGASGVGFSVPSEPGRSVIIVNPSTGALMEAQNIPDQNAFAGFGSTYLAPPPTPSLQTEGGSYEVTIQRLDPIGRPTVVPLPANLSAPLPLGSSGTITATAKVGVTSAQILALEPQLQTYGKAGSSQSTSPVTNALITVYSFNGSAEQILDYAKVLNESGLFTSVVTHQGTQ